VPSHGESTQDELSLPPAGSGASEVGPEASTPPAHGTRRRHRRHRRRVQPAHILAAIGVVAVVALLLGTQLSWLYTASATGSPSIATPSRPSIAPSSLATPSAGLPNAAGSPTASQTPPAPTESPHAVVANRIVVPRLGIDMRIVEGDGVDAPLGRAAHFPGSSWPGGGSNIYLYGHARDGMFIKLWDAHLGDEVVLTLVDGSQRRYVVSEILPKVTWDDMSVLQPTPTEQLSLQTCTSYQPTAPRFLVIAVPEP